jgi:hypothetical protein
MAITYYSPLQMFEEKAMMSFVLWPQHLQTPGWSSTILLTSFALTHSIRWSAAGCRVHRAPGKRELSINRPAGAWRCTLQMLTRRKGFALLEWYRLWKKRPKPTESGVPFLHRVLLCSWWLVRKESLREVLHLVFPIAVIDGWLAGGWEVEGQETWIAWLLLFLFEENEQWDYYLWTLAFCGEW